MDDLHLLRRHGRLGFDEKRAIKKTVLIVSNKSPPHF